MVENTKAPESDDYVPSTPAEIRLGKLESVWRGLRSMGNLKWSHYANAMVRRDGKDHHFELDWLKYVEDFLPPIEDLPGPSRPELLHALTQVLDLFHEVDVYGAPDSLAVRMSSVGAETVRRAKALVEEEKARGDSVTDQKERGS